MRIAIDPDFLTLDGDDSSPEIVPDGQSLLSQTKLPEDGHAIDNSDYRSLDCLISPATGAVDMNAVKVITTIPPESSYPKTLYPYTPIRLLPMSRFADVGRFCEWSELKEKVMRYNDVASDRGLRFTARLTNGFSGMEYNISNDSDFRTALKVAELSDDSLDIIMEKVADSNLNPCQHEALNLTLNPDACFEELRFLRFQETSQMLQTASDAGSAVLSPRTSHLNAMNQNCGDHAGAAASTGPSAPIAETLTLDEVERIVAEKLAKQRTELEKQLTESITQKVLEQVAGALSSIAQPKRSTETVESSTGTSEEDSGQGEVIHSQIICDHCDIEIRGVRYKCSACLDFDLCSTCEEIANVHSEGHTFLKIRKPLPRCPEALRCSLMSALHTRIPLAPGDQVIAVDIPSSDIENPNWSTIMKKFKTEMKKVRKEKVAKQLYLCGNGLIGQQAEPSVRPKIKKRSFGEVPSSEVCSEPPKRQGPEASDPVSEDESVLRVDSPQPCRSVGPKIMFMSATLVADETITNGTHLPPGSRFKKVWRVRNTGTKSWNSRTTLKYCWGNELFETEGKVKEVPVPRLKPWEEGRISLNFLAPAGHFNGLYQSHWRLHHRGQPFGQRLICQIVVDPRSPAPEKPLPELKPRKLKNREAKILRKEKTHKDLTEVAVKMIRFHEAGVKTRLQSHTATPLNTPFEGLSPPKSPEPPAQPDVMLNLSEEDASIPGDRHISTRDFGFSPDESAGKSVEEKEIQVEKGVFSPQRSPGSADGFSWSCPESSDEFVVVQLPKCFDLNAPFDVREFNKLADQLERASLSDDEKAFEELSDSRDVVESETRNDVLVDVSDFSLSDNSDFENVDHVSKPPSLSSCPVSVDAKPLTPERVDSSLSQAEPGSGFAYKLLPIDGSSTEPSGTASAVSLATDQSDRPITSGTSPANVMSSEMEPAPELLDHPTNPFASRRGENVIHVLPESIVNGAVSAAAQVVQNVSRVLFAPHERVGPGNNSTRDEGKNDVSLMQAMSQLFEMGFWNENLNQELLELNRMDLSDTVSALLQSTGSAENGVVRTQPQVNTQVKDPFIEFD